MRAVAIAIVLLVLGVPASSALLAPIAPPAEASSIGLPGPRDGDVILLMAKHRGIHVDRLPIAEPAAGDTIPLLVARLAVRAGYEAPSAVDLAAFDTLDPRLVPPVLALLVAVEQAWDLRDFAFEGVDPKHPILSQEQEEQLVAGAILLLDTLDAIVIPQLQALSDQPVWPPVAVADPVGILRIGSAGNDVDSLPRAIMIDGRGDDTYLHSIAYAAPPDLNPLTIETPVAVAVDIAGNDTYRQHERRGTLGDAYLGIGVFYDLAGRDTYLCVSGCLASVTNGLAVVRDVVGQDDYNLGDNGLGSATGSAGGLALFREDAGEDRYEVGAVAAGVARNSGFGIFWDRAGFDRYNSSFGSVTLFGDAEGRSHGWHVDDGSEADTYWNKLGQKSYGQGRCSGCIWSSGVGNPEHFGGRGNNGRGGLPFLFAYQDTH